MITAQQAKQMIANGKYCSTVVEEAIARMINRQETTFYIPRDQVDDVDGTISELEKLGYFVDCGDCHITGYIDEYEFND